MTERFRQFADVDYRKISAYVSEEELLKCEEELLKKIQAQIHGNNVKNEVLQYWQSFPSRLQIKGFFLIHTKSLISVVKLLININISSFNNAKNYIF